MAPAYTACGPNFPKAADTPHAIYSGAIGSGKGAVAFELTCLDRRDEESRVKEESSSKTATPPSSNGLHADLTLTFGLGRQRMGSTGSWMPVFHHKRDGAMATTLAHSGYTISDIRECVGLHQHRGSWLVRVAEQSRPTAKPKP
jgi:hypothetical protein